MHYILLYSYVFVSMFSARACDQPYRGSERDIVVYGHRSATANDEQRIKQEEILKMQSLCFMEGGFNIGMGIVECCGPLYYQKFRDTGIINDAGDALLWGAAGSGFLAALYCVRSLFSDVRARSRRLGVSGWGYATFATGLLCSGAACKSSHYFSMLMGIGGVAQVSSGVGLLCFGFRALKKRMVILPNDVTV